MKDNIHKTAILEGNIKIGENVKIGPYSVLNGNITIGDNTTIEGHVNIKGDVEIGQNNTFYPFCSIGTAPQDAKFKIDTLSRVLIGDNNTIREYVTINGGGDQGNSWKGTKNTTVISNNCYIYISAHIAHDVFLEDNVTITNSCGISGHVLVQENTIIGGMSGLHQNIKIGKNCMIGALSAIGNSVPPFCLTYAIHTNKIFSLNLVGLRRFNFSNEDIKLITKIYNNYYKNKIKPETVAKLDLNFTKEEENSKVYKEIESFFGDLNTRGALDISERIAEHGF
jgi:UDP-N-acetylglucosamine acyltransferase